MTLVGWLADKPEYIGGAELTQAEFKAAAPDHAEVVDFSPGQVIEGMDAYVIHNCTSYSLDDLARIDSKVFKYWHDIGPHVLPEVRDWLDAYASPICCSPLQADHMGLDAALIPPPIPLERFREAAENAGERSGAVSLGPWMNWDKSPLAAQEWAEGNGGIDFYGDGPLAPLGAKRVPYEDLPEVLARYKTFVHLPRAIEPFGRSVVEAWAAGCSLVLNRLVGARYWIEEAPEKLEAAGESFWQLILEGSPA